MAIDVAHRGVADTCPEPEDLATLLERRGALRDHEEQLSFWRRIVQGRIDVLRARLAAGDGDPELCDVLGSEKRGPTRAAHVVVRPYRDMLELATCDMLWEKSCDSHDEDLLVHALDRMIAAEKWLSHSRSRILRELDLATADLKKRLVEDPAGYLRIATERWVASEG